MAISIVNVVRLDLFDFTAAFDTVDCEHLAIPRLNVSDMFDFRSVTTVHRYSTRTRFIPVLQSRQCHCQANTYIYHLCPVLTIFLLLTSIRCLIVTHLSL